jgi:hypothetical protein
MKKESKLFVMGKVSTTVAKSILPRGNQPYVISALRKANILYPPHREVISPLATKSIYQRLHFATRNQRCEMAFILLLLVLLLALLAKHN